MGGSSRQKSDSAPWIGQQPFLKFGYGQAQDLYNQGPMKFFGGQTFAGIDPGTQQALDMASARGLRGDSGLQQASGLNQRTMRGDFLGPRSNPFLQETFDVAAQNMGTRYADIVGGGIGGRFGQSGGTGSPQEMRAVQGAQGQLGGQLRGLASDVFGGNYQQERGRQMAAAGAAPAFGQARFGELQAAGAAGAERERYAQQPITEQIQRHDFGQNASWDLLSRYNAAIGGPAMGQSSRGHSFNIG